MEKFIIDMLTLNAFSYARFEDDSYLEQYGIWLEKLKQIKGFETLEQTADYLIKLGEMESAKSTLIA